MSNMLSKSILLHSTALFVKDGRTTDEFSERAVISRLQLAIIEYYSAHMPSIVCQTLIPSGFLGHIDAASLINQMHPDMCVVFGAYPIDTGLPTIHFYTYGTVSNEPRYIPAKYSCIPDFDAYLIAYSKTKQYQSKFILELLNHKMYFESIGEGALPLLCLEGIAVPSLYCELGIPREFDIVAYASLLAGIIASVCV